MLHAIGDARYGVAYGMQHSPSDQADSIAAGPRLVKIPPAPIFFLCIDGR